MKKSNIIVIAVLAIIAIAAVATLVHLENQKPDNLEEYVVKTPESMNMIESFCETPVFDDKKLNVKIKKNTITYSLQLDEMEDYIMVQLKDQFEKFGQEMEEPFKGEIDFLTNETEFEDISVVLVIKDSEKQDVFKKEYK